MIRDPAVAEALAAIEATHRRMASRLRRVVFLSRLHRAPDLSIAVAESSDARAGGKRQLRCVPTEKAHD